MKILVTAATRFELYSVMEDTILNQIETLVTGVGMTSTAYVLGKHLANNHYDLIINVGIAGAFNYALELSQVVEVQADQFSELGAEDGEDFLNLDQMGLSTWNEFPFQEGIVKAKNSINHQLEKVIGTTVNKVHGNEKSITEVKNRLNPDVESMEGAAFLYVCANENTDCIQLRAISNYVERRNRNAWQIDLALSNLAKELSIILNQIL